ncbi:sulfotransferase [uncultured Thiodictyon sp.]|uniref:sulfotransferase family protein n=1 Tax=uncultured Thiodictyon sp. TaxID=1846217 RepID=UPI0025F26C27|nr:sulfotransferase [uncultured Thiodictyon sp.]
MTEFMQAKSRQVIVVLGTGRSGTSLLMQILGRLGMGLSANMIGPHHENPDGFFEDADVLALHKQLLVEIGAKPILPLPDGWRQSPAVEPYRARIRSLVEGHLSESKTIWGVKDPRLSSLLPLWIDVLKSMWVVPIFVLAVREVGAVVRSIAEQANISQEMAELVWLFRTCDALLNSAGNCHIVHYEDWFTDMEATASALLSHTGLDRHFEGDVMAALDGVIKPRLNRSIHEEYKVANPYVLRLDEVMKGCRGSDFDRERLMLVAKACRLKLDGFKGWYLLAHQANKTLAETQARLRAANAAAARVKELEARIRELEEEKLQSGQLVVQVQKLQRQLDQFLALGAM